MMNNVLEELNAKIDALALATVTLDPGDIPGLGRILQSLEAMEELCRKTAEEQLVSAILTLKSYAEQLIMGAESDLTPLETGISQLQAGCINLIKGKPYAPGRHLNLESPGGEKERQEGAAKKDTQEEGPVAGGGGGGAAAESFGIEDLEIVSDFVSESRENLNAIENKLMDLEQDPADLQAINDIFRPFHTIKGVSGFLNFDKINRLSHTAENLLDKARNRKLDIDDELIDIILAGRDLLEKMIANVEESLQQGKPGEGDVDINELLERIERFGKPAEQEDEEAGEPLGKLLVDKGVVSEDEVEEAVRSQKEGDNRKLGEILVEEKQVDAQDVVAALNEQKKSMRPETLQVRVDTEKLDSLVDLVGELAIAQSMLRQSETIKENTDRTLYQITNQLNVITSTLQRTAMSLRMVPIKNSFQKMVRLARDLARKAGKEVQLSMSGEDTEIDRNMVDEIYEPIVHMVRNSVDHGLEAPAARKKANKPKKGAVHLRAYHKGGDIVIEIEDDGKGLNREKILAKGREAGLVKEEELSDSEIDNLIFHPGFSTADKVTDISGRGVGTDVVKNKIEKLRGRVDVQSVPGEGAKFILRLPLTLAIIDGMIIRVAEQRFIVPTLNILESFRPPREDYFTVKGEGEMIKVRESLYPLIRLDQLFGLNGGAHSPGSAKEPWERLMVLVEHQEKKRCFLIDELIAQEEIVIKSLGGWINNLKGIAGGAILGDGVVGLILDIAGVFDICTEDQP